MATSVTVHERGESPPYDPAQETDPLIQTYIELNQDTGEPVLRGTHYPVWSVVLNLKATNKDWARVQAMFPELSREALQAAMRFWRHHKSDIQARVEGN
jgi:uncharacterized protein (DUF433 family)